MKEIHFENASADWAAPQLLFMSEVKTLKLRRSQFSLNKYNLSVLWMTQFLSYQILVCQIYKNQFLRVFI